MFILNQRYDSPLDHLLFLNFRWETITAYTEQFWQLMPQKKLATHNLDLNLNIIFVH